MLLVRLAQSVLRHLDFGVDLRLWNNFNPTPLKVCGGKWKYVLSFFFFFTISLLETHVSARSYSEFPFGYFLLMN
jgi:hypothetical protein